MEALFLLLKLRLHPPDDGVENTSLKDALRTRRNKKKQRHRHVETNRHYCEGQLPCISKCCFRLNGCLIGYQSCRTTVYPISSWWDSEQNLLGTSMSRCLLYPQHCYYKKVVKTKKEKSARLSSRKRDDVALRAPASSSCWLDSKKKKKTY